MTEIWQEPARGGFPPDGFLELTGMERARARVQGLVPRPPIERLFGIRYTHASPGTSTMVMPASPWLLVGVPGDKQRTIAMIPLVSAALHAAAGTAAPPGSATAMHVLGVTFVRRATLDMETFVARARNIATGPSRSTVEVHVEDVDGRLVVHATSQAAYGPSIFVERSASAPVLEPVVEPTYATPDPPARPLDIPPSNVPLWRLMGIRAVESAEGEHVLAMRSNDWLLSSIRALSPVAIHTLLGNALLLATHSATPKGMASIQHDLHVAFTGVRTPPGRNRHREELLARAEVRVSRDDSVFVTGDVTWPGAGTMWFGSATGSLVSGRNTEADVSRDRVLAAVLYTDIVGSTPHAERLGDARWKDLLEEFHDRSSKQVTTFRGREVKWTGDGVLAMFDSPARAVQCARALHEAAQRQNIEIRAGIHVGECELMGADVAGIAVHVAQRVLDKAEPGAILVTSTVREAAAGSGLRFTDRGRHELKGVEGDWQLYAVE